METAAKTQNSHQEEYRHIETMLIRYTAHH